MKLRLNLAILMLLLFCYGCGKSYPSVSGKVTFEGKPAAGVNVMFLPLSTKDNPFPGPFAQGKTDQDGNYRLVTRYGDQGATPGPNMVEFYQVDKVQNEFMDNEIERLLQKASGDSGHPDFKKGQSLKSRKDSLPKPDAMQPYSRVEFTVPPEGTDSADFELTLSSDSN